MKINRIKISNILGINELEFEAGRFVEITGKNGTGKSSVIEAIKAALEGGTDATLLRRGADKGEVVVELDDGTTIARTFNGKTQTEVRDSEGNPVARPASYIEKLIDIMSINPVSFLTADKKTRANVLLESLDMKVSEIELRRACGECAPDMIDLRGHALDVINRVYKSVYDERTGINRVIKQNQAKIDELAATVATELPAGNIEERLKEHEQIARAIEAKMSEYKLEFTNKRAEARAAADKDYEQAVAALQTKRQAMYDMADSEYNKALESKQEAFNAKHQPLIEEIARLKESFKSQATALKMREMSEQMRNETELLDNQSNDLSKALAGLDELKLSMLNRLPIKGLEIRDGQVYRDGVHFDRLNTAQQVDIAVEIAKLRAGHLGIICVDGLERLDAESFELFKVKSLNSNLQLFITQVTNEPELKISSEVFNIKNNKNAEFSTLRSKSNKKNGLQAEKFSTLDKSEEDHV
jgi:energy-coupling factor transporter ATP-binding protein EcfA2